MPEDDDDFEYSSLSYDETLMGLECWEYAWVRPEELNDHGADRWRVVYMTPWYEGKVLMERKRLADDAMLREMTR